MTSLATRIDLARQWFVTSQGRVADGAGWGWVSDVPPNPQNTAEVVCALGEAGLVVPERAEVERLLRTHVISSPRGDWVFREPIDLAWQVRALRQLGAAPDDSDLPAGIDALLAAQSPAGGWRMAARHGPMSVTATSGAILALVSTAHDRALDSALRAALLLARHMTRGGPDHGRVYPAALAAHVLSVPRVAHLAGSRIATGREVACDRLLEYLSHRRYGVETAHVNRGGFRTSPEGFVTSYATTQALDVLTVVRQDLDERVSPAIAFDLICYRQSAHHTDPQTIVRIGNRSLIMNSLAGLTVMSLSAVSGIALIIAAELLASAIRPSLGRVFLVLGSLIAGLGVSSYLATRLHRTPGQRVVVISFTLFTALFLPVLTFVLD